MKRATRSALIAIAALGVYGITPVLTSGQQGGPGGPGVLGNTTYSTGNIAVPIPDFGTVDVPIAVPVSEEITDVNVSFRINHSFDQDLQISLVHPDGTVIALVTSRGGGGDNFGTGANDSTGTPTVIDDEAPGPIAAGAAPFAGTFQPESALSALDGKLANGTWQLRVADGSPIDSGTIGVFNLQVISICNCAEIRAVQPPVLVAEAISPGNNAVDPNETVTVNLALDNVGLVNTTNLVATLQAIGGVVNPGAQQNYGVVVAGGGAVTRPFTFTATGACGGSVSLSLQLQDGAVNLGVLTYTLRLGTSTLGTSTFSNSGTITIPGAGTGAPSGAPADPYPSNLLLGGVPGTIERLTVRLNGFNHPFPGDVDVLLVSPSGAKMIIMSDVGGGTDAINATITLDDAAGAMLDTGPVTTGTYRPTNVGANDLFPASAPAGPYLSPGPIGADTLGSAFAGAAANGTWSLYVTDDASADAGTFDGGWSLTITTAVAQCHTATAPTTPTGIAALPGYGKAIVTFNASASNGGSAITSYIVTSDPPDGMDSNAGTTGLRHVVTGLVNGTIYTFRVRALNVVGVSAPSGTSNAVMPPGLTDFPLQAGVTSVKVIHIVELRQRIDKQRVRFGLNAFPWTDPVLTPGGTTVRAIHILDLRTALAQAYTAAGITPQPAYTDAALGPSFLIKQVHLSQIQAALGPIE